MKKIVVIGGGITGLTTMYELQKWKTNNQKDGIHLTLLESLPILGGKIRTIERDGFLMEAGADSIVARKIHNSSLLNELNLEEKIVYNNTGNSFIYTAGHINPIPKDTVFGIPASIESLACSTLVSAEGKVEALKDFYTPNETFTEHDSIGDFLEHFFGKELVEKQIAPVLSGVYSGNLYDLPISSTLPDIISYKEKYGSIIKGFSENKQKFIGGDKKFISFRDGLHSLIKALEEKLKDVEISTNKSAKKIRPIGSRYEILLENQESIDADIIVLSIPNKVTATLLDGERVKEELAHFHNSSLISVYAGFDLPDEALPLDGTGYITADTSDLYCNACTWTSRKWKHTSKSGNLLTRLFYKSSHPLFEIIKEATEEELLLIAKRDLECSLGIQAEPIVSCITKWNEQMPNYTISHPQDVRSLEERMAEEYPQIFLAGCSYYGVGIPDCIQNGQLTAQKIIHNL